jgi:hypothetical protein
MSSLQTYKKLINLSERRPASVLSRTDPQVKDNEMGVPFNYIYLRIEIKFLSEMLCLNFVLLNNGW